MNTTDSAAILEAIHQAGLAKRGINPQPARPSRAPGGGAGRDGNFQSWAGASILKSDSLAASPEESFGVRVLPFPRCAFPWRTPSWSFAIFALHSMSLREALLKGGFASPSSLQTECCRSWSLAQMMHFSTERGRLGFERHPHSHPLDLSLTTLQQPTEAQRDADPGREREQNAEWNSKVCE